MSTTHQSDVDNSGDHHGEIHFSPPLYKQRYNFTINLIENDPSLKTIIDIGCGTGHLFSIGRHRFHHLRLAVGIDINRFDLDQACFHLTPLPVEYLHFRRETPLKLYLLQGDATKRCSCFQHFDVVTLIEVIEHLPINCLMRLVDHVFAQIKARLVLVTTPNADFNCLFSTMIHGQFRHPDHKFEFTRTQFHSWAEAIAKQYDYRVEFHGLGEAPSDEKHRDVGFCTQIAIFRYQNDKNHQSISIEQFSKHVNECDHHKMIRAFDYPYGTAQTIEEKAQIQYILDVFRMMAAENVRHGHDELNSSKVDVKSLLCHPRLIALDLDRQKLETIVRSLGYEIDQTGFIDLFSLQETNEWSEVQHQEKFEKTSHVKPITDDESWD